ncbi:hypothetical protein [Brevundimonas sp. SORGH_AS_0993]|uniref:HAAS signaling domain-containing protein n=1 Tax=Brevundimonas sp. SORGH_AS_0993 TaxID=3041794 RepID=UPI00278A49BB|nr:hypothetical protein [Brevundimonas sp. SORGH_AS_0993]MDQ1154267.1 hypothetical protein [Brevundimonas sp. SORGH_AS_0993]
MDLVERYLNAVAAQLPKETRDDIVAELRDEIMGRIEALEARLGRAATDDEVEVLLREVGHPLTVAARYRSGPQALIGPELYPWWMFGVKVGLTVMACVTLIGLAVRVLVGDVDVGPAIGQGVSSLISGAIAVVGLLTAIGFVLERQQKKPDFIARWRVKDLGLFQLGGDFDAERWGERLARGDWSRAPAKSGREVRKGAQMSPVARAVASAIGWTVVLLWWTGLLQVAPIRPDELAGVVDGVDYGRILADMVRVAYWPVALFAVCRIGFDLMRAASGGNVRVTALGDLAFGIAAAWGVLWIWFWSALSPIVWVGTATEFMERVRRLLDGSGDQVGGLATILMIVVVWAFAAEVARVVRATARLIVGR